MKKNVFPLLIIVITSICLFTITVDAQEYSMPTSDFIILFNNNSIDNSVENFISKSGGKIVSNFSSLGAIEVNCNVSLLSQLKKYPSVNSISPNHKFTLCKEKTISFNESLTPNMKKADLYDKYQWDIKQVTSNGASYNLGIGNHNVVVGIIDSGVNKDHPDLKGNFLGGENFIPKNFENDPSETGDSDNLNDKLGHGTHIAGTIAGNGRILGVAPNIGFKSYRIFNSQGDTNTTIVTSAILKAVKDNVKVINLSFSGYDLNGKCFFKDPSTNKIEKLSDDMADYSLYKRAIKYALNNNVVVITSAGNDSLDCANKNEVTNYLNSLYSNQGFLYRGLGYEVPGRIKGVINVSATTSNSKIASYSNYGNKFIDIAAPGGDYLNNDMSTMCLSTYNNSYTFMEGTSMATPKVSAIAALIICKYPRISYKDVAKKVYKSAEKSNYNSPAYFGHGLANAYNALKN